MRSRTIITSLISGTLLLSCSGGGGGGNGGGNSETLVLAPVDIESAPRLSLQRIAQGGATTSSDRTSLAFENPAPNLSPSELDRHLEGDRNFGAVFVSPPAIENPGLGPLFNNTSCEGCHTKNGRGQPVFGTGGLGSQAVMKVSTLGGEPELPGGPGVAGVLGTQLQDHATFGTQPEGQVTLDYDYFVDRYADGTPYELRSPVFSIELSNGAALSADIETSLRVAPPIFGVGLLEAIPSDAILAHADPDDANGDGISGRPNLVFDVRRGAVTLGRFGRKANNTTLLQQSGSAYLNDMGVSNPLFPAQDGTTEIDQRILSSTEFYTQTLAVPRADAVSDPVVERGEKIFVAFKCASCHVTELRTGAHPVRALSGQTIFPYTDLLLHDMGPGLADNRSDFGANGSEWRTPPLWGIGITATILSSTANFLHDGRARTLEEAVLWHGGEGLESKERFRQADKSDRDALVRFLKSL